MDKKSVIYSAVLLVALMIVAVMLSRGMVQAVVGQGDLTLSSASSS